jgi:hypothetical protein
MSDYKIQSILFNSQKNTLKEAIDFLISHDYLSKKLDITDQYYRFRQISPEKLEKEGFNQYRTITIDPINDIKFIIVYNKKKTIKGGLIMEPSKYI